MTMTDQQAEELLSFGPAIDDATVEELERIAASKELGQQRRCALLVYSRSCEDLSGLAVEAPEAFKEMQEFIEAFSEHAAGLKEVADSALIRIKLADIRATRDKGGAL